MADQIDDYYNGKRQNLISITPTKKEHYNCKKQSLINDEIGQFQRVEDMNLTDGTVNYKNSLSPVNDDVSNDPEWKQFVGLMDEEEAKKMAENYKFDPSPQPRTIASDHTIMGKGIMEQIKEANTFKYEGFTQKDLEDLLDTMSEDKKRAYEFGMFKEMEPKSVKRIPLKFGNHDKKK